MHFAELTSIRITSKKIARIKDGRGMRLRVEMGAVWITEDRNVDDLCLKAGESYCIKHDGMTLISVLRVPFAMVTIEPAIPVVPTMGERFWRFWERLYAPQARPTMIDSTDALLLRPARPGSGFEFEDASRRPHLDSRVPEGLVVATIYPLASPVDESFLELFERRIAPALGLAGASILASFATEHSPNNFPRLVLRDGEDVFVLFCGFKNEAAYHGYMTALGRSKEWRGEIGPALMRYLRGRPQVLRLAPTSRSQVRM